MSDMTQVVVPEAFLKDCWDMIVDLAIDTDVQDRIVCTWCDAVLPDVGAWYDHRDGLTECEPVRIVNQIRALLGSA
jgi:hypothetical protein